MRYLALIIAALTTAELQAYELGPRLIVSVSIDQLRSDYMEAFSSLYSQNGFKRLLNEGLIYDGASYSFVPLDRSSAAASISTGTTPFYNGIIGDTWLDRKSLQPVSCVYDGKGYYSASNLLSSTIGDEIKVGYNGKSKVFSFATSPDAAVLLAGHAADGAFWLGKNGLWTSSTYYSAATPQWVRDYNNDFQKLRHKRKYYRDNDNVVDLALKAITAESIGSDDIPDYLSVSLSAVRYEDSPTGDWLQDMASVYQDLDLVIARLIGTIEKHVSLQQVMFVITSTGHFDEPLRDLSQYRIPTGTFYINRTASLLNMYLGAMYGSGRYVEQQYGNQIYLDNHLIDEKHISRSEILDKSEKFLMQCAGVADVYTSERIISASNDVFKVRRGYCPAISGDIIVRVASGWQLVNEDNGQSMMVNSAAISFPIIFMGAGIAHERIATPVTVDRIAPTIAKSIRIRAPNSCSEAPLF